MNHQSAESDASTDEKNETEGKKKSSPNKVPISKLFSFADRYDYLLMFVGSIGACVHGASVPVFFIFFGKMINVIGMAYLFPKEASHHVAKVMHVENVLNKWGGFEKLLKFKSHQDVS